MKKQSAVDKTEMNSQRKWMLLKTTNLK